MAILALCVMFEAALHGDDIAVRDCAAEFFLQIRTVPMRRDSAAAEWIGQVLSAPSSSLEMKKAFARRDGRRCLELLLETPDRWTDAELRHFIPVAAPEARTEHELNSVAGILAKRRLTSLAASLVTYPLISGCDLSAAFRLFLQCRSKDLLPLILDANLEHEETLVILLVLWQVTEEEFRAVLRRSSIRARRKAIRTILEYPTPRFANGLFELVADPEVRGQAIEAMKRVQHRLSVRELAAALTDPELRGIALDALVVQGATEACPQILPLLQDPAMREKAESALRALGMPFDSEPH